MMFAATAACSRPADKPAPPATAAAAPAASTSSTGAPVYRVDPFFPKTLPNNWIVGQVAGLAVDAQDHVCIIQRPSSVSPEEGAAALKPPAAIAAGPRPRSSSSIGRQLRPGLGRTGRGLRVAEHRARHLRRPRRQRLDHRQRRRRHEPAEVLEEREVPAADRQARRERRQQRHRSRSAGPRPSKWTARRTRSTSPTATRTSASSSSMRRPAPTSGTGAPTATCQWTAR